MVEGSRGAFLASRLLFRLIMSSAVDVGPGYKPSSGWVYRRYPRVVEGVLARSVRLVDKVEIVSVDDYGFEARVASEEDLKVQYSVRVYVSPIDPMVEFECTCPYGERRFNPCKHVTASILALLNKYVEDLKISGDKLEEGFYRDPEERRLIEAIYEGLNKAAYIKARSSSKLA
ncbi:MAG: hypothetical protein P3X22_004890 [Thermoprotei archaeon]|nr:hypothetical protein [Thermoprotei archaeon]